MSVNNFKVTSSNSAFAAPGIVKNGGILNKKVKKSVGKHPNANAVKEGFIARAKREEIRNIKESARLKANKVHVDAMKDRVAKSGNHVVAKTGFISRMKDRFKKIGKFIANKATSAFNFVKTQTKKAYGFIKTQATKAYGFVKNHKLAAGIVAGAVAVAAVVGAILYKTQNSEEV